MSDKLREVAKDIGKTKRDAEAALRRYNPKRPKIERTRDIFDSLIPFEMEFDTADIDQQMTLNLFFNKPPPAVICNSGELEIHCENYIQETFPADGATLIQVAHPYNPGSVTVYIGCQKLAPTQYYEYDPTQGLVYVTAVGTYPETITVCYISSSYVFRCPDVNPLDGTIVNHVDLQDSYNATVDGYHASIAANSGAGAILYDPDEGIGYNFTSTQSADLQVQILTHEGFWAWYTHLDDLANLPSGSPLFSVNGTMLFDETIYNPPGTLLIPGSINPSYVNIMDWSNFRCALNVHQVLGEHYGEELLFFTQPPESAITTLHIGSVDISLRSLYNDRPFSTTAYSGNALPPRIILKVSNIGARDANGALPGGTHVTSYGDDNSLLLPIGEPVPIIVENFESINRVFVIVGPYSFNFDHAYFRTDRSIDATWTATSYLVDHSTIFSKIIINELTPCGVLPPV